MTAPMIEPTFCRPRSTTRCATAAISPRCSSRTGARRAAASTTAGSRSSSPGAIAAPGLRVVRGETTGFAHTADLSRDGLAACGRGRGRRGPGRWRRNPTRSRCRRAADAPDRRRASCCPRRSRSAARSSCSAGPTRPRAPTGSAVTSVTASYADARRRILVANSDGLLADDDRVRTRFVGAVRRDRRHRYADRARGAGPHDGLRALRRVHARGRRPRAPRNARSRCSTRCPRRRGVSRSC